MKQKLFISKTGNRHWRVNDYAHRIGGPAIELDDGVKEWWIRDVFCFFVHAWYKPKE